MTSVLTRPERLEDTEETQRRRPYANGDRYWSVAASRQRIPRIVGTHWSPKPSQEAGPADA